MARHAPELGAGMDRNTQIIWQTLLGLASLICFATAISWIRATYAMHKSGETRPLLLPFPIVMMMDIYTALLRRTTQNRLPPNLELGIKKMRFESTIINNYLKAFILLIFSFIAGMLVFQTRR
ncbi:MAG TPA: hypothetical protein VIY68_15380 [Steroidobacteraceae bacterium]